MIIGGGKDDVIPFEVTQKIYDSVCNAIFREMIIFPNASHKLTSTYFPEHPQDLKIVVDKIIELLK